MNAKLTWNDAMVFEGVSDGHTVTMDAKAPIGKDSAPTPKDLVAMGLAGCTAMDVIALLKKYKQLPQSFSVDIQITPTQGKQPATFESAALLYTVSGDVEPAKLLEAVHLSQSKYCGVSAMLSKAFPIRYSVELNGIVIGTGKADFQ